ncbi:sulfurtransferase [Flavobacterium sp. AG291]|uniref:sulfurtransferase n=1 Tax=Flavobacterium sp. AG291 TaxID=2184000 RepID=UPI000E0C0421|nr:sulfurtransferase [Flavobacterium sp. AG291]RDI08028.1 thiosulfate/3-mercaptopyruvate sulfurtransferase [Flavobacterium sp. AG291]
MVKPIIQPLDLIELVKANDVVIIDAGNVVSYGMQHLKGAKHIDLNTDMANVPDNAAKGGRHPLPDPVSFGAVLGRLGIKPHSHVVVYDDKNGALSAARFWWMLKAAGHKNVQVLNGGVTAAAKAGFPLSDLVELSEPAAPYVFTQWQLPQAYIDDVEKAADNSMKIIDVRAAARFRGETEPLDAIAGHIPGAINVPYETNLDADGFFLEPEILAKKYLEVLGDTNTKDVIVHCGSGVTACHALLAIDYAGLPLPRLYVGSWSEWSGRGKTVAVGE